jgi:hypothetical protein
MKVKSLDANIVKLTYHISNLDNIYILTQNEITTVFTFESFNITSLSEGGSTLSLTYNIKLDEEILVSSLTYSITSSIVGIITFSKALYYDFLKKLFLSINVTIPQSTDQIQITPFITIVSTEKPVPIAGTNVIYTWQGNMELSDLIE